MADDLEPDLNLRFPISPPKLPTPSVPPPSVPPPNATTSNLKRKRSKFPKIEPVASSSNPSINPVSKPKRPDPGSSEPRVLRSCTECGKTFYQLKALFGHMRCHPERQWRGIKPPAINRRPVSPPPVRRASDPWVSFMSEKDYTIAACLLMLANSNNDRVSGSSCGAREVECCAGYNNPLTDRETNLTGPDYRFECGGFKKVFVSHQALGGHRATHKNVKGCFASNKPDEISETVENRTGISEDRYTDGEHNQAEPVRLGLHRCSICFRVFTSGQALGGHMRCHWEKPEDLPAPALEQSAGGRNQGGPSNETRSLDLNLPPASSSPDSSGVSLDLRLGL